MVGQVRIMGIVNLTDNAFYPASRVSQAELCGVVERMCREGADCIDLGACSTNPGAEQPDTETEWERLAPALQAMRRSFPGLELSVDTYRAEIACRSAEAAGCALRVNDISGGLLDKEMLPTVGRLGLPYVFTHFRGTPQTMQNCTDYTDVVADVESHFAAFEREAERLGIHDALLDPGFGFAKTVAQNYAILRRLGELASPPGGKRKRTLLVGISRKSMIYKPLGILPEEALTPTQALHFAALERGAKWLRVHDVAAAVQTARLYSTMYTSSSGAEK